MPGKHNAAQLESYSVPPQGRADYAFWQHILRSLAPDSGRCAILFPHGVLFRQEEIEMRRNIIEADLIEFIIGLGTEPFLQLADGSVRRGLPYGKVQRAESNILFVNAINEVTREHSQSFLTDDHIAALINAETNTLRGTNNCKQHTITRVRFL